MTNITSQVVDEADRLLTQSFHDWLPTVLSALKPSFNAASLRDDDDATGAHRFRPQQQLSQLEEVPTADALAPSWWDAEGRIGRARTSDLDERCLVSVRLTSFVKRCSLCAANALLPFTVSEAPVLGDLVPRPGKD